MARKCQSKNPSQCPIHGLGGKQEQLHLDLTKALAKNDISKAVELRQQLDSLSDTVESNDKEKSSFFSRLKSNFKRTPESEVDVQPVPVAPVDEKEPYTGLLTDCGKCNSCDPPPSDLTHFRHMSNGTCDRPIPMPVSEVTRKVLSRNLAFNSGRTAEQIVELQSKVSSVLEDSSKSEYENGASKAAAEVRDMLWDDFSEKNGNKDTSKGGFASAASTTDLFHALGREKELGWITDDAPGYGHQVERNLRTDALYSSMQQLITESPSSFKRKHEAKREQNR
jgi:hypothetical protein